MTARQSVFQNSPMMAKGKPDAAELALLEPFRGKLPDEVFGEPYVPPVTDGSGQDRRWLRRGAQLLNDAGFALKNGKRVLPDGKPITIEFLLDEPTFTPHHLPYIKNLGTLGIDATLRVVDPVQYRARVDGFDFDITVERFSFSATPGDSLRTYFSSQAAATKGSQNLAGIADPAVDALVDIIIAAKTRAELTTACKALDRVIRAGRYWIPHWYKASHWIAYWDVFGRPAAKPRYFRGIPETWWYDRDKAAKLERSQRHSAPLISVLLDHAARNDILRGRMTAYIIRRLLFIMPTMFGIMLVAFVVVQFAPGGPVEQVIAKLTGTDTGATSRISGSPGGDFGSRGLAQGGSRVDAVNLQISRRAGARSGIHQEAGKAVRLRQAGL